MHVSVLADCGDDFGTYPVCQRSSSTC